MTFNRMECLHSHEAYLNWYLFDIAGIIFTPSPIKNPSLHPRMFDVTNKPRTQWHSFYKKAKEKNKYRGHACDVTTCGSYAH